MTDIHINQIVRCFTGEYSFCLDARMMEDLHLQDNYLPEPGEDGTVGQLLLGDNRIPVFSMGQRLGLAGGQASEDAVILQLRAGEGAPNAESWGLLVDRAEGPLPVSPGDFREIPSIAGDPKHGPFPWLVRWEDELVTGLDPEKIRGSIPTPMMIPGAYQTPVADGAGEGKHGLIFTFQPPFFRMTGHSPRMAVSGMQVLEVVGQTAVAILPMAPPFITGVCNWRGRAVPVVDVAAWLGLPAAPYRDGCKLLICRTTTGGGVLAVPASGDVRRLTLTAEHRPWPGRLPVNPDLALGAFEIDRSPHVIPDLNAVTEYRCTLEQPTYTM